MIMPIRTDWTLDETVMPEDMNDIGKELNRLKEEDKKLESKKLDKTGGTVTGTINATNLQVGGANVYTTSRKPTSSDVGASPVGHSHDDRYFTEAEMNEKLKTKVSVESGKGLSTNDYTTAEKNKLAGIAAGANVYTHPSSHPATMITEDSTHRFITDEEKQDFNNKISKDDYEVGSNGICKTLDSRNDIRLINKSGKYSGVNVTGNPTGTDAFYFYDVECMSNDVRIVTAKTADSPLRIFIGSYISKWIGWKEVFNVDRKPTPADIGALGATAKAESAKVADAVAWANVSGKPSTFAPSSHAHSYLALSGGTITGDITFNKGINITGVSPSDISSMLPPSTYPGYSRVFCDSTAKELVVCGADNIRLAASGATVYTTTNKPTPADIGAVPESNKELKFFGKVHSGTIVFDRSKMKNGAKVSFMTSNKDGTGSWHFALNGKWVSGWTTSQDAKYTFEFTKIKEDRSCWFYEVNITCSWRGSQGLNMHDGSCDIFNGEIKTVMVYQDPNTLMLENLTALIEYY